MRTSLALGLALGLAAGWWVGESSSSRLDDRIWWLLQAAIGGFQGWGATWILRQSADRTKMWTAILLTGPVLASIVCILSGEPFTAPVLAATVVGSLCAAYASWRFRPAA